MKIQYFATDLAYALDLGEIVDMHVETLESGVQVLRIDCLEKKKDEYQTIKARPGAKKNQVKPRKQSGIVGPGPCRSPPNVDTSKATEIGGKIMDAGKKWFANKDKPNFMKDAGF